MYVRMYIYNYVYMHISSPRTFKYSRSNMHICSYKSKYIYVLCRYVNVYVYMTMHAYIINFFLPTRA